LLDFAPGQAYGTPQSSRRMKLPTRIFLLLAAAAPACVPRAAADTLEIKQLWLAGKKYYQTMRMDQKSTFAVGGQKLDQSSVMTIELTMAIEPPRNGQPKKMTVRYERMAMEMDMNGQKMS